MRALPRLSFIPGPTRVAPSTLSILGSEGFDASPDLEPGFFADYSQCCRELHSALGCAEQHSVAIMSGEAMVALWGAVKSVLLPGDHVLCVANGVFGDGFAEMARAAGATATVVSFPYDAPIDMAQVRAALDSSPLPPRLVTAVHCETPSGLLNPNLHQLGQLCQETGALFLVDFVASAFAVPVHVNQWKIDLGLLGSQKVLSLPPDLGVVTVSDRAWKRVEEVQYRGYDALLPFKTAVERQYMPYSHNWRAISAMKNVLQSLDLEESFQRHAAVARFTRERIADLGLSVYAPEELCSPSVTAVQVPDGWNWPDLDAELRKHGVIFGGSYGLLKNRVFRIGHMGTQANLELVSEALDILAMVAKKH